MELRRDGRAPKVANTKYKSRGDWNKPARLLPNRVSQFPPTTPSSRDRSIHGCFSPNVFLFQVTGHFFPENVFRPATDPTHQNNDHTPSVRVRLDSLRYPPDFSSEFSQSPKAFVSGLMKIVRGSLKCVRGGIHHVQIVLPGGP